MQSVLGKSMCSAKGNLADNRQEDLGFQTTNLGRVLAECNPYFSAVDVQINEKLSFETDVAVLFAFIVPNTLHILGLTSWSTCCCYTSINHFLGGRITETLCAVFLQKQEIVSSQPGTTCDISLLPPPCPVFSVTMASPEWCWGSRWHKCATERAPCCQSAPQHLSRECAPPHLPLPTPSHSLLYSQDLLRAGV